ncbi:MAG: hypothetical protein IIZ60_07435, partial [Clostridia bacterium]|nr:hypothetical protein [Clostridia bacterium]
EAKTRKFVTTADLEPLPTIIDGNAELNIIDKTIVAKGGNKTIEHDAEAELDGQMSMEGFKDDVTPPEKVDEDHAEDSLRERRVKRIQDFKLDADQVAADMEEEGGDTQEFALPDEPAPNQTLWELRTGNPRINHTLDTSDYISDREAEEDDFEVLKDTVDRASRRHLITAIIQGVLMIAGLVLTILIGSAGGNLEIIAGSALVTILINMAIVVLAAAVGFGTIRKGIKGFFRRQINASGAATIVVLACLLEDILLLIVSSRTAAQAGLYTGAACLALLFPSLARYFGLRRAKDNLTFMNSGLQLYGINIVESEEDTASIVRGMQMDDSVICYNGKIKTPTEFIRNSFADDPADYYAEKPTLIILGAAVLYALIFGLVKHSFAVALSGFAVVCCIAIPAYILVASNIALFLDDSRFSRKGSAILGHRAVEESAYVNTYAIDSTDLFPKGTTTIIGIKTFHNMRIDDAILYAAALVIESKGPLTDVFENTILGKNDLLPPVETLAYEERLGLSAWIRDRRVLFGNRALMTGHNVDVPTEEFEAQYTHNDRKVMYLAIAGKVAAMFVIKYRPVKMLRPCLRHMDRSGITVLVHNTDCNVNEDMICKYYKLPKTAVKVLSPAAGDKVEEYLEAETYTSDAGLLHNGTVTASMRMLYEARRLYDGVSINNILAFAYSILAVILAVILGATSSTGLLGISDLKIVLFQIIWGLLAVGLPVLRCRATKKLK